MKPDIHPKYYQAAVQCACGNQFTVGSTKKEIKVEVCSQCHPFFTGKQKFLDSARRVDKFVKKYGASHLEKIDKKAESSAKDVESTLQKSEVFEDELQEAADVEMSTTAVR